MNTTLKDSAIPWIGLIPQHWEIERGKSVLNLMQRHVCPNDEVITCFRDGEVILRKLRREEGFTMSDKEIGYQGINKGDIVIHGMDGFAGAIGISKSRGKGTPVYVVCTPKQNSCALYVVYYLRTLAQNNVFLALSTGIRERSCDLKWNKISVLPFPLPPLPEQEAIANFLDRKCSEIDAMLDIQTQFIEQLKAYKQSLIAETVTHGLNPTAPTKDSHIPWIGSIPLHWEVSKLKFYITIDSGDAISSEQISKEGKYPVYGGGDIMGYCSNYNTTEYELIIGRVGARCGCVTMPRQKCWASDNALVLKSTLPLRYTYYLLQAIDLNRLNTSNAQPLITATKVKNVFVPLIPIEEQQAIVDFLDKKCAQIDELIATKQQKINALHEYKKSIIYEYVTGKRNING